MNSKDYQIATRRTDLEDYSAAAKRIEENKKTIHEGISLFMLSSGVLDIMKKKVMYDADPMKLVKTDAEHINNRGLFLDQEYLDKIATDEKFTKAFHYIIGIVTEANEMMVALAKASKTGSLDLVNVGEELGDSEFYSARLADLVDLDLDTLRQKNIDKLAIRYPEKFTNDLANNRDLDLERQVLEA